VRTTTIGQKIVSGAVQDEGELVREGVL
jgi:hypothetical protein